MSKKRGSVLLESIIAIFILLMVMLSLLAIYDSVYRAQTENIYRLKGIEVAQTVSNLIQQKGYNFLNSKAGTGFSKTYSINSNWTIGNNFTQDFDLSSSASSSDVIRIKNLGISPQKLSITVALTKTTPTLSNGTIIYSNDQTNQNFISGKVLVNWTIKNSTLKSAAVDFIVPEIHESTKLDTTT